MITQADIDGIMRQNLGKYQRIHVEEAMSAALLQIAEKGIYEPAYLHSTLKIMLMREVSGKNRGTWGHQRAIERKLKYEMATDTLIINRHGYRRPNDGDTHLLQKGKPRIGVYGAEAYRAQEQAKVKARRRSKAYRDRQNAKKNAWMRARVGLDSPGKVEA